jgi:hypothetical protein
VLAEGSIKLSVIFNMGHFKKESFVVVTFKKHSKGIHDLDGLFKFWMDTR